MWLVIIVFLMTLAYIGVGGSIKIMNYKYFIMTKITQFLNLKKLMPAMVVFAVLVTVFSFSSYDPYNELAVLTPENAQAALVAGSLLELDKSENTSATAPSAPATNINLVCNISVNGKDNATINQGDNAVISWQVEGYGQVTLNGNPVANSGTLTAENIQQNTTYTIRAQFVQGNDTFNCNSSVRIICQIPAPVLPECELNASLASITAGQSVTLTWTTQNANSASMNQGIGSVAVPSGSYVVSPTVNTTYILTVFGANNRTGSCFVKVVVNAAPLVPACVNFNASEYSITPGQSVTLSWKTIYAIRASISPNVGPVPVPMGAVIVHPTVNTTYTLTVFGEDNTSGDCTVTIIVTSPDLPVCVSFTPKYTSITRGESVTLSWTTRNATQVSISGLAGPFLLNGSRTVSPTMSTTYTLLVTGANGLTDSCTATVTVSTPEPLAPKCL